MKIYFLASSRLVGKEPKLYGKMYAAMAADHKMLSDKVLCWIKAGVKDYSKAPLKVKRENYEQSLKCLNKADVLIMEVSAHSMSMGYLLSQALEMSKPVIALYKKGYEPVFIKGIVNSKLLIIEYDKDNVEEVINKALDKADSIIDVRFNFFVNSKILSYLDWVSDKKMLPRSVFLRNLIEKEMRKDREFKG
jgi:hypothetical protein